jgi:bifunctional DNA-binding transcriptional regulator/antitoxin component of YhaV-PrlF toxin-antitoxin module
MKIDFHTILEVSDVRTNYVMKVSANGQVSIPAETRARWHTDRVIVVDLGDRVVLRPLAAEPVKELRGKYRDSPLTTDEMRRVSRAENRDELNPS